MSKAEARSKTEEAASRLRRASRARAQASSIEPLIPTTAQVEGGGVSGEVPAGPLAPRPLSVVPDQASEEATNAGAQSDAETETETAEGGRPTAGAVVTPGDVTPEDLSAVADEPDPTASLDGATPPASQDVAVAPDPEGEIEEPLAGPVTEEPAKRAPAKRKVKRAVVDVEQVLATISGPESRLERSGEPVQKVTLDLPLVLMDAIARWELDVIKRTGRRVYRERLFDLALAELPEDADEVIEIGRGLSRDLKFAETEQVGTRVRASVASRIRLLRPEMKVRRTKDVYLRHVHAAALVNFLQPLGLTLSEGEGS